MLPSDLTNPERAVWASWIQDLSKQARSTESDLRRAQLQFPTRNPMDFLLGLAVITSRAAEAKGIPFPQSMDLGLEVLDAVSNLYAGSELRLPSVCPQEVVAAYAEELREEREWRPGERLAHAAGGAG